MSNKLDSYGTELVFEKQKPIINLVMTHNDKFYTNDVIRHLLPKVDKV